MPIFWKSDRNKRNFTRKPTYSCCHSYSCNCWLWFLWYPCLSRLLWLHQHTRSVLLCGKFLTYHCPCYVTELTFLKFSVNNAI
jgi:hypothetical protein